MDNPIGYLYRVGQTRTRPRKPPVGSGWDLSGRDSGEHLYEPGLLAAVGSLSEAQRVAVVLVHGYGWTLREVAELTGVTVSTVQTHVDRALTKLRGALEVVDDA